MPAERIGFIGCGHMGGAMAARLLGKGHALVVCDPDAAALAPLLAGGAERAPTPRAVADQASIVFACLPSPEASLAVALGEEGVALGADVRVYVEASTIGQPTVSAIARGLEGTGIELADMPVSGGPAWAAEGNLTTILAASPAARARLDPVLPDLARRVLVVGDAPGLAQVAKLVNNLISFAGMLAACEAIVLGVKAGLDADLLLEVVNAGTGRNSATADKFPRAVLTRRFDYGGPLAIGTKDIDLYRELGRSLGMPTFVGDHVSTLWNYGVARGAPDQDYSELVRHFEAWAGVTVRGKSAPPET
ncbi:NAD(P)-dependent oxidoreductase [Roseomonas nepalensis]|uniref:NAD(P)-dependent oxidoreductase n=1 Tax=Muricoccus nepalensis TaxID=1854500 RepID=A0A502G9L0_9PROT|nr:NAD(P)-dependent oxidoreductase [Roseomonas nepalensis]TPG58639.1 NAD(P)-dependent oxidoreductase [Roseomonas nepalensis]